MKKNTKTSYIRDKRSPKPSSETASKMMSRIKGKNTKPEKIIRSLLYQKGLRGYRVHYSKIEGKPDIVFSRKRVAISINGCFWHKCPKCNLPLPKSNTEFWKEKLDRNIIRDKEKIEKLKEAGWHVETYWECEIKSNPDQVVDFIEGLLN